MPVTVVARNLQDSITVLASDIKGTHSVEWAAAGDPSGDDIQYIPEEVHESVAFKRALARGVVELMPDASDPAVVEALDKQVAAFKRRQQGAREAAAKAIDRPLSHDHISVPCVGPDNRDHGACGEPVAMPEKSLNNTPPLCSKHQSLANMYVPEDEMRTEGDKVIRETRWIRVNLGARESV